MTDFATLKSNVSGVLGLDPTQDGNRIGGFLNQGVLDILLRTHCYVTTTTITLTANVGDYTLDDGILAIEDIYLNSNGANFRVRRLATTDLINLRLFSVTSAPIQMYALSGANLLMVYPSPLQPDVLHIYYVPRPTAMSSDSDDPSLTTYGGIPEEFNYGLELYAQWKAADMLDDSSSSNGETYRRLYLGDPTAPPGSEQRFGFIGTMKRDLRAKGGKHLAGVLIPPRNRRIYVPQPGFDVGSQTIY